MEAAQQAYSESNAAKLISLIYTILATVVLGYGAKMFLLSTEERDKQIQTITEKTNRRMDEIYHSASNQFGERVTAAKMDIEKMQEDFSANIRENQKRQRNLYASVVLCQGITQICYLIQSIIGLSDTADSDHNREVIGFLNVKLVALFGDFIFTLNELSQIQWDFQKDVGFADTIRDAWDVARGVLSEYIDPTGGNKESLLCKIFGPDEEADMKQYCKDIQSLLSSLPRHNI